MLSIRPIGCGKQQVSYYTNLGREDYYVNGGEAPGVWYGSGAEALGLNGQVQGEHLKQILLGFSADGISKLVQNAGRPNRRSAFDLTWSAPKSVSVAWSLSDDETRREIERRCEVVVRKVADAFQLFCGVSRRGHDGIDVQESRLAMALFRHETARGLPDEAPDPNLHWHMVVPNVAVRPDGSTGAIRVGTLFEANRIPKTVRELAEQYDDVVTDAPARLDDEARALMVVADVVIFPMEPTIKSLRSTNLQLKFWTSPVK